MLIDLAQTRLANPATDIVNLISLSVDISTRTHKFNEMIAAYFKKSKETLEAFGFEREEMLYESKG